MLAVQKALIARTSSRLICATAVSYCMQFALTFCKVLLLTRDRDIADVTETDVFDDVPPSDDDEPNQLPFDLSSEQLSAVYRLQPDSQKP